MAALTPKQSENEFEYDPPDAEVDSSIAPLVESVLVPSPMVPRLPNRVTPTVMPVNNTTKVGRGRLVYVQGVFANAATKKIFRERGFFITDDPLKAELVVWTGGEDISPCMYNEKPITGFSFSNARDLEDINTYNATYSSCYKIGICRGAQLLNVLSGGSLWQDVSGHNSCGTHPTIDVVTGEVVETNSMHHQQMIPTSKAELVAYAELSKWKRGEEREWKRGVYKLSNDIHWPDPEVVWYDNTKSLCFQAHPEFGHPDTTNYFFDLIDRYCS